MSIPIKQVFIVLLSFSKFLAFQCMLLNDELCIIRPFPIDLNPVELKYYPFMISLDNCIVSCNSVNDLSITICLLSKTEDVNVKVFNIITNRNEAKSLVKHFM